MIADAALRERRARYRYRPGLRESELTRLWQAQRLPPEALVNGAGELIHVVYRGRRGAGPGPDFRDAVIGTAGASLLKGDVELHVRSSDFYRHGHHLDRAYLRLVLHVVFEDDGRPTELLDGRIVPVVALGRWVHRRAGELRALLTDATDDYREPCHTAVIRLGAERAAALLIEMGESRLRERAARFPPLIELQGAEQSLYAAIARALGLPRNGAPLEAIAATLTLSELRAIADRPGDAEPAVEAALLGAAGLLGNQLSLWSSPGDDRHRRLLAAWHAPGAALKLEWVVGSQRPGCAPADRLAGLATLVCRAGPPLDATLSDWQALLRGGARSMLECLLVREAIGRDRAIELAVNAVLPWLLAAYPQDEQIRSGVIATYRELPGPQPYGCTRALSAALLDGTDKSLVRGAAATQGALQMTYDWCTQGGCGRCPLS